MQFRVGKIITDQRNNLPLPKKLVDIGFLPNAPKVERTFNFVRNIGYLLMIPIPPSEDLFLTKSVSLGQSMASPSVIP